MIGSSSQNVVASGAVVDGFLESINTKRDQTATQEASEQDEENTQYPSHHSSPLFDMCMNSLVAKMAMCSGL